MGVVTSVRQGSDGRVRRASVSYKNLSINEPKDQYRGVTYTTVERPVHRLIVIVATNEGAYK